MSDWIWKQVECPQCNSETNVMPNMASTVCPKCGTYFTFGVAEEMKQSRLDKLMAGAGAGSIVEEE